jgi:hypothetical protein
MNANDYLRLFKGIYEKIDDTFDKERLAIAIMQEITKDSRMALIEKERKEGKQEPATVKQIGYLKILGVSVNKKITKKKAGRLIEMALRNNHSKRF